MSKMKKVHVPVFIAAAICLALLAVAAVANQYILYVLTAAAWLAILTISFDVLLGYTGYLSLAHGAFYGIGAYALGNFTVKLGWNFWLALLTAGAVTAVIGGLIAALAFRTRGIYFAILTLGIGLVGFQLFIVIEPLTGGVVGFVGIPSPPQIPGLMINPLKYNYILSIAFVWMTFTASYYFVRSHLGTACLAVREDDLLARSLGIKVNRARLAAFSFSAFFAGIAGGLFGAMSNFAGPDSFSVMGTGFQLVVAVVVGGMGTLWGPALGSLLLTVLPELLRDAKTWSLLAYGILLLIFIEYAPSGIAGLIKSAIGKRPERSASVKLEKRAET